MQRRRTLCLGLFLVMMLICAVAPATEAPVEIQGRQVHAGRLVVQIAPSGLPEQIVIHAAEAELPLEWHGKLGELKAEDLLPLGRGPQLRAPVRIEVSAEGKTFVAEPTTEAKPEADAPNVSWTSALKAGPVTLTLACEMTPTGTLLGTLNYSGGRADAVELVLDLAGPVDTAIDRSAVAFDEVKVREAAPFVLGSDEGEVWSRAPRAGATVFVGSGDRGWTWTAGEDGWTLTGKDPSHVLERDKAGNVRWRIRLVNKPGELGEARSVRFRLLTHPAASRPKSARRRAWLDWPAEGALRADRAAVDPRCGHALLTGPAGGDAVSAKVNLAETVPMPLFRYLAGTHTGMTARLQSNSDALITPGMNPTPDRVAIGRALVHDIGLDCARLADKTAAARIVKALYDFGYFEPDGRTEFLPYWRNSEIIRYGDTHTSEDAFALTAKDPLARVHVSVFRRPADARGRKAKALIVILNETDKPVREQLYVLKPDRLWRGGNTMTEQRVLKEKIDFRAIPKDSDWRKSKMLSWAVERGTARKGGRAVLEDLEDHGVVQQPAGKGGIEVYGIVHVPAHSFRILYGTGHR